MANRVSLLAIHLTENPEQGQDRDVKCAPRGRCLGQKTRLHMAPKCTIYQLARLRSATIPPFPLRKECLLRSTAPLLRLKPIHPDAGFPLSVSSEKISCRDWL